MIKYDFLLDNFTDSDFIEVSEKLTNLLIKHLNTENIKEAADTSVNANSTFDVNTASQKMSAAIEENLKRLSPEDFLSYKQTLLEALNTYENRLLDAKDPRKADLRRIKGDIANTKNKEELMVVLKREEAGLKHFLYQVARSVAMSNVYTNVPGKEEEYAFTGQAAKLAVPTQLVNQAIQNQGSTDKTITSTSSSTGMFGDISSFTGMFTNEKVPLWLKVAVGLGAGAGAISVLIGAYELYKFISYGSQAYAIEDLPDGTRKRVPTGGNLLSGLLWILGGVGTAYLSYLIGKNINKSYGSK
jgi:hypothetical protein